MLLLVTIDPADVGKGEVEGGACGLPDASRFPVTTPLPRLLASGLLDLSEISLGGPADANDIFSASNSTGPSESNKTDLLNVYTNAKYR